MITRERIISMIQPVTWTSGYDGAIVEAADFLLSRIRPYVGGSYGVEVSFERLSLDSITVRNPRRQRVSESGLPLLRQMLMRRPDVDSCPIVCGRTERGCAVWDGHHRLRTYELAGRADIPALVADIRSS